MRLCFATLTLVGLLGMVVLSGATGDQGERDNTPNFVFSGMVQKLEASNVSSRGDDFGDRVHWTWQPLF